MKDIDRLEDLTPDPTNPNEGTLRGSQLLERSLETYGAGRSILVDRNGVVVAGNKTLESAVEHGLPSKVVRTDGQTLVVVQRTDLDMDDPKTRALAYLDNRTAEVGLKWNPHQLEADLAKGIELGGMFDEDEREGLLRLLDQAAVVTVLHFDSDEQLQQFQALLRHLAEVFPGLETVGDRLTQWVSQQLTVLDPVFTPTV